MGKGLSFGRLLIDFSLWCTIVCLNKIVTSAKWMAIVFTFIFFAMCFLFIFISINCTLKFFKFPASTELSIDMKNAPFPRFSFCNENPMKRSVIDLFMANLSDADRIAAGYSFTELVTECTFAGVTFTSSDFTPFLHPEYGVCFTFNGERTISKAGKTEGLRMLMTVNVISSISSQPIHSLSRQDSPLAGKCDFFPTTDTTTVWGLIYDDADYPDFMKDGFRVGASTQSFVALSKSTHSRLEEPYGNCTEDGSAVAEYYGNYTYTLQSCQHACLQRMAQEKCGCVDPLYPKIDNQTLCTTAANMLCLISLTNEVSAANSFDGKTMCGCLSPCVNSVYDKTITNSIFPSEKVATGTQAHRGILLGEQGGGRQGGGSDDSDDYENPVTVTVRPSQGTTSGIGYPTSSPSPITGIISTTSSGSTISASSTTVRSSFSTATTSTTMKHPSCSYKGPPMSAKTALSSSSILLAKLTSTTTPCEMADLTLQEAIKHYSSSGKRRKRDTTNSSPTSTVDVPGFGSCEYANKNFNGGQACIEWFVAMEEPSETETKTLEVKSYTQGATYTLVALISDISGHAGLWLGMSVVSVVELIGLIFMCFNALFCGRKFNLADDDEIKKELNNRERAKARQSTR